VLTNILFQVLDDPLQGENKIRAAEYLIHQSKIEGLEYWAQYIRENKVFLFEHKWAGLQSYISDMPSEKAIDIFLSVLSFMYENNMQDRFSGSYFIEESIYGSLITIALKGHSCYIYIHDKIAGLTIALPQKPFIGSIKFYSERLNQRYFEAQSREINFGPSQVFQFQI
jgi:hypothetical protein